MSSGSASPSVQRLITSRPPSVISGSLRSYPSNHSPTLSTSSRGEVHFNDAFDSSGDGHQYDSITAAFGPRKKTNYLYEEAPPSPSLPLRRKVAESERPESTRSSRTSSSSADSLSKKERTHLSKFMVFVTLVIFSVSVAALALVILTINGTFGPKCACTEGDEPPPPKTGMSGGVTVQSLQRKIRDLEKSMVLMKTKMETQNSTVENFVKNYETQVKLLQSQVSVQERLINETAMKVNFVNCSSEKKPTTMAKISLLNTSVNTLINTNNELKSAVSVLQQNHILEKQISAWLGANVTRLRSDVQELRKSVDNTSNTVGRLERGYDQMASELKALQAVNGVQNASHNTLQSDYKRLVDSMVVVNATLNKKLDIKAAANFSSCEHRVIKGTPVSPGDGAIASVAYTEQKGKKVTGIACSTDFAQEYKLESKKLFGFDSYECTCRGLSQSASSGNPPLMHCYLHLWECLVNT